VGHQLEDEPVEHEVRGGDAERRLEAVQLGRHLVGRRDLVPRLEAEHLLVEALRPLEVGDHLARVVVDAHRHPFCLPAARMACSWLAGGPVAVPPSTGRTTPVTYAARSLARYSTALATSSGTPWRCSGCVRRITGPMS